MCVKNFTIIGLHLMFDGVPNNYQQRVFFLRHSVIAEIAGLLKMT